MTLERPSITVDEAGLKAMIGLFCMRMERLLNAEHTKCQPLSESCIRGVDTSYSPGHIIRARFYLCSTSQSSHMRLVAEGIAHCLVNVGQLKYRMQYRKDDNRISISSV